MTRRDFLKSSFLVAPLAKQVSAVHTEKNPNAPQARSTVPATFALSMFATALKTISTEPLTNSAAELSIMSLC